MDSGARGSYCCLQCTIEPSQLTRKRVEHFHYSNHLAGSNNTFYIWLKANLKRKCCQIWKLSTYTHIRRRVQPNVSSLFTHSSWYHQTLSLSAWAGVSWTWQCYYCTLQRWCTTLWFSLSNMCNNCSLSKYWKGVGVGVGGGGGGHSQQAGALEDNTSWHSCLQRKTNCTRGSYLWMRKLNSANMMLLILSQLGP